MSSLVLLAALLAAPGDTLAVYVTEGTTVLLNTEEKDKLGIAAKIIWPALIKSNIIKMKCHRPWGENAANCKGGEETVPTDEKLLTMVVNKEVIGQQDKPWQANEVELNVLAAFTSDAFGGDISTIYAFHTWRDVEAPSIIWATPFWLVIDTPAQWRIAYNNELVLLTLAEIIEE